MKITPVLTEKSNKMVEETNTYTFAVTGRLNKIDKISFAQMIEQEYDVRVVNINSSIRLGKPKRSGRRRTKYYTPDQKLFYVKIEEGEVIPDFNVMEEEEVK
jgi:ribosomal protein L23